MSNPERKTEADRLTPQGNAPSWVDEVLGNTSAMPGNQPGNQPDDLRLPHTSFPTRPESQRSELEDWINQSAAQHGLPSLRPLPRLLGFSIGICIICKLERFL